MTIDRSKLSVAPVPFPKIQSFIFESTNIFLLGTVKGLLSEKKFIKTAFHSVKPDAIALHISPEELIGLEKVAKGKIKEMGLGSYETIYAKKLSQFGEVQVPPPSLVIGYKLGVKGKIPIAAIDIPEQEYSDAYVKNISTFSLIRHSQRLRWIRRKKFKAETPEDFVLLWDASINSIKGYRKLELAREVYMAERIIELAQEHSSVMCVLEYERFSGIAKILRKKGFKRIARQKKSRK